MEILLLDPTKIKVRQGLERYRQDMGELNKLADSIERVRQILPVIITRDYELVDGGRRLAACLMKGMKVKAVFEDVKDDYEFRELELEANLYRKDYTPAEEALAIRDLNNLKMSRLGKGGSGQKEGWSISDTASLLGKSRGSVYNAIEMANMIDAFPQLRQAKKKSEIKKAAINLQKLSTAIEGIAKNKARAELQQEQFSLIHGDCTEHMLTLEDSSVDILLTDPLYGIGADLITSSVGGGTGGAFSTAGFKIEDPKELAFYYYHFLAKESIRFCTPKAHGYVFVGPEHFNKIRDIFLSYGWLVHVKPIIWIKKETGQCNIPHAWPASCYEMLLYIRREDSHLIREGMPDWVDCPPVPPSEKRHPYQKPVALLSNLLDRVALPGQTLYDPFAGSATSIEAGIKHSLYSIGVEKSKEAYATAVAHLTRTKKHEETKQ